MRPIEDVRRDADALDLEILDLTRKVEKLREKRAKLSEEYREIYSKKAA